MNTEKEAITNFIINMLDKDYANANKSLHNAVEEKLKNKIRKEIAPPSQENLQDCAK